MLVMAPWAFAVGFAVLARWLELEGEEEPSSRRSIEVCVGSCSALWLSEDGVLRVYAEETSVSCYRLVVDCSSVPSRIPGEIDGYPVRIRVSPDAESPDQQAARLYARKASELGYVLRPVRLPSGQISVLSSDQTDGSTTVLVEGARVSPELDRFAEESAEQAGVSVSQTLSRGLPPFGGYPAIAVRFRA